MWSVLVTRLVSNFVHSVLITSLYFSFPTIAVLPLIVILAAGAAIYYKKGNVFALHLISAFNHTLCTHLACRISACQPEVNSVQEEKETDIVWLHIGMSDLQQLIIEHVIVLMSTGKWEYDRGTLH